ncbi:MAG: hypothetical protein E6176_06755 [Clostridium celatum]|uniref:hypothetical protein n=1 Tax=uncultured Clostridium sp. TaxID=59620 RepID=UPI0025D6BB39|nr:hypothetical protein [uncultured Clostridium sp.]MDU4883392.1 hypothetical protein [Clostridium celatum]MDU5262116.1 hypothetical protein [Clostridium celatum]MDU7076455.1 hypothetical protein [Clostridium celatum]
MFNILKEKSPLIKISQIILFITTILYILESIFLSGLFTNVMLATLNLIVGVICIIISLVKKEYKLTIIDLVLTAITMAIFMYLTAL